MWIKKSIVFILLFTGISSQLNAAEDLRSLARRLFGPLPATMPGSQNDTLERIALGRALYFETALSANRTQSCESCHTLKHGGPGTDNLPTSFGALGEFGRRNSPTVWNAGFQSSQFWDGRARNLKDQAKSPLLNPLEMALSSEEEAVERLSELGYGPQFAEAYPNSDTALTFENILESLAAFQRTLITTDRFDAFMKGDDTAMTDTEKQGLRTFIKIGCSRCHTGPLMGGKLFAKMGLRNPYPNKEDKGRAEITGKKFHEFVFKVPTLRNVSQTAPYFHDGAVASLDRAVKDTAWHQVGLKISDQQTAEVVAFLKTLDNQTEFK
ncbi:cytochrome-c peroxidase [Kordiimonas laminariae]|uniref:cytochrome-c peroxidase n=1 Tax=Kordiimonas laminariae TaxID=2917717 RepID=UPI001FF2B196|nr:cytochrome c peroxidase [Kordiimonas laminariae]MCK0069451.1 c-type cytochrome [Kordiimonas laminariae]